VAPVTVAVLSEIVWPTQSGELLVTVGVDGIAFTVIVIALLVAGLPVTPDKFDVITQVTICPVVNVLVVYVVPPVPTFAPFTFHWYVGAVPPLVGVAVNVTEVPAQIAPVGLAAMVTPGVTDEFTVTAVVPAALVQPFTVTVKL